MVAGNLADLVGLVKHLMIRCLLLIPVIFLIGCSSEEPIQEGSYALPEEATLELREVFRISEPAPGVFFSSIRDILLLGNGNIIVRNGTDTQLYELTADGKPLRMIGREGRGPGEFQEISKVLLTPGDSLHTFDNRSMRHQVWAKGENGEWVSVRERLGERGSFFQSLMQTPEWVVPVSSRSQYGVFRTTPLDDDTLTGIYHHVRPVNHNLEPDGEISRMKRTEDAIVSPGALALNHRFYRAHYIFDPLRDEVIYIRNTSNEIIGIDARGEEVVKGLLPYERFPRSEEGERLLREAVLMAESLSIPVASDYVETRLKRMLAHEPYYRNILFDGERLWVHLERSVQEKPNWVITGLDGEVLGSFHGPPLGAPFQMMQGTLAVRGNRIYGRITGPDGTVYLAGYDLVGLE